jgi:chromosome segregation protein
MAELARQISELNAKAEILRQTESKLTEQINKAESAIGSFKSTLETIESNITSNQKQVDETSYELRLGENELERLTKDINSAEEKQLLLQQKQYSLNLGHGQLSDQKQTLVDELHLSSKKLEDIERAAADVQSLVGALQVKAVEVQSKIDQCEHKISHTKELLDEISRTIETKTAEIENAEEEIENAVKTTGDLETKLKLCFESRTEITESQGTLKQKFEELQGQTGASEKQLKELRLSKDKLSKESHAIEMQLSTFSGEVNSIIERMRDDYDVQITEIETQNPIPEMPEAEAREHLSKKKDSLKNFGAVNLLALEEYQSASQRKEFLEKQLTDLEAARDDLMATITKINKTARTLFEETFEKVKVNFQTLFAELFEGGEASLYLEDPNEPLESDIEITARPRGKKLISITMMSGGERALTAISLLFSLYQVKPSAYCILDEIDAPLDDANCRRFLKLISSFADNTQFIIITHNKITMEAADNLYGITMASPGISQIVAVKFNQVNSETGEVTLETLDESAVEAPAPGESEDIPQSVVERISPKVEAPIKSSEEN